MFITCHYMRGATPPLPQYVMTWFLVKHRDNSTFTFTCHYKNSTRQLLS